MKILICVFKMYDYGGIINWVEHLCHGLKELDHTPSLMRLESQDKVTIMPPRRGNLRVGHSGNKLDQEYGWVWDESNRFPLFGDVKWQKLLENYDGVIWAVPVPPKNNLWDGWQSLYEIANRMAVPQVMVIHDSNLDGLGQHAKEVMPYVDCVVGVHPHSYNMIPDMPHMYDKMLIPNPQVLEGRNRNYRKQKHVFSCQTFKEWKRVEDLVKAVPFIKHQVVLAGGGIERDRMANPKSDRDRRKYGDCWKWALYTHRLDYMGYMQEDERDDLLSSSWCLIDPSWRKSCKKYGSHLNRVFVDAILAGTLPIGRDMLTDGNPWFDPCDYVTIPWDATPQQFADVVNSVMDMSYAEYGRRMKNLYSAAVEHFDSVTVAQQYVDLLD